MGELVAAVKGNAALARSWKHTYSTDNVGLSSKRIGVPAEKLLVTRRPCIMARVSRHRWPSQIGVTVAATHVPFSR